MTVRLVPLSPAFRDDVDALQDDPDVQAFTRFPMPREDDFADRFLRRSEDGLADGVRAGGRTPGCGRDWRPTDRFEHAAGRLLNMVCRYEGSESCSRTARASAASR